MPKITDTQITALESESHDIVVRHICRVALRTEAPVRTSAEFEGRYGGGGLDAEERRAIMQASSPAVARRRCAEVIRLGRRPRA